MSAKVTEVEICLVMFIGLPGCGKTTLCRALVECFKTSYKSPSSTVHYAIPICYDELIPADVFQYQDYNSQWKEARRCIVNYVKTLVLCLKGMGEFSVANSHEMAAREELLRIAQNEKQIRVYIIIDDNMYYRSMRYEYYQLARLYSLGFCQLFVQCSVSVALNNNSSRDRGMAVPDEIITRMAHKLEPPDGQNNPWETFSLTVPFEDWTVMKIMKISDFLSNAAEHPVVVPEDDSEVHHKARIICLTNVIHQVDVTLRKLVGDKMREGSQTGVQDQLQVQSKALAVARRCILEGIKMGKIIVPEDICEAIELGRSNGGHRLQEFLNNLFTVS
jgi:O-phosphoseryl-tRNA(Sec) kinase